MELDLNWLDRFLGVFISENADGTSEVSISSICRVKSDNLD